MVGVVFPPWPSRASLRMDGSRGGGRAGGGATPPCASANGRRGARDSGMLRSEGSFQASAKGPKGEVSQPFLMIFAMKIAKSKKLEEKIMLKIVQLGEN